MTNVRGGEARSRREIAGQLARAANESSFTRVPPPLATAARRTLSAGPSFSLGLIAISLEERLRRLEIKIRSSQTRCHGYASEGGRRVKGIVNPFLAPPRGRPRISILVLTTVAQDAQESENR